MYKVCTRCDQSLPLSEFTQNLDGKHKKSSICKHCNAAKRRSIVGAISKSYYHQLENCRYRGYSYPTYSKQELIDKYSKDPMYLQLHQAWMQSGYTRKLTPSFDRIDDHKSYSFDNLQVVTWAENKANHHANVVKGTSTKYSLAVDQLNLEGNFIQRFSSITLAAKSVNSSKSQIAHVCKDAIGEYSYKADGTRQKYNQAKGFKWRYSVNPNTKQEII